MTTASGLLSGLVVLDCSDHVSGQFASRLFADHGAHVCLVEPPGGSPIRTLPPLRRSDGSSLLFWHLNGGKQSRVIDRTNDAGRREFEALACRADVLICANHEVAKQMAQSCPRAMVGVVTDFAPDGPYAHWKGCELIFQALSGSMYITGIPGREPLYGVGRRTFYSAGLWLYISLMAQLIGHKRHGHSYGVAEVNVHEAACAMEENFTMRWAYSGQLMLRGGDPSRAVCTLRAHDGWAILFLRSTSGQWRALCEVADAPHLINDPRFANFGLIQKNWNEATREINERLDNMPLSQLIAAAEKVDLVIAAVETAASLRTEDHLNHRGFWQQVGTTGGMRCALGPLFGIKGTTIRRDAPAPEPGTAAQLPNRNAADVRPVVAAGDVLPLEGLSVIDFTTAWAGPMSTKILAQLGATVVKIEGPAWLDSWRGPLKPNKLEQYPDGLAGARPYDRCARFNAQNHDKHDVCLDLKAPEARDVIRRMLPKIDVVVANFRPGALARLGLDHHAAAKINPQVSLIEMPAVGEGPFEHRIGLGPTMEAMAGIADRIGYADSGPLGSGTSYLDPMGALHGASAALTVLYGRLMQGRGFHVELAQREAAMHWIGEILLDAIENDHLPLRDGNAVDGLAPHNAYPAAGEDEWICIAAFDDRQWSALCQTLCCNELLADARFLDANCRYQHRHELDVLLGHLTRKHDKHDLAVKLQEAGVPAAPVVNGRELFNDPQLRSRDWFTQLTHPQAGTHDYAGLPLVFAGSRLKPRRASPCFGEHTRHVLTTMAGLSEEELETLAEKGVTAESPRLSAS